MISMKLEGMFISIIDGLVQDFGISIAFNISIALAMEILQTYTKTIDKKNASGGGLWCDITQNCSLTSCSKCIFENRSFSDLVARA